mmetsp:Transcript_22553/g.70697  ORF Transcript_22553/g.70697 Transcript_22553/m.70697 type:complete len:254 (+) Transcript_22553:243-1004(+)
MRIIIVTLALTFASARGVDVDDETRVCDASACMKLWTHDSGYRLLDDADCCASATAGACKSGFRYSAQLGVCDQQKKGCESLPTCCTPCEPEDKKCGNCVSEAWPAPRRRRDLRGGRRRCHRVGPDFGRQENCSSSSQWDGMGGLLLVLGILLVFLPICCVQYRKSSGHWAPRAASEDDSDRGREMVVVGSSPADLAEAQVLDDDADDEGASPPPALTASEVTLAKGELRRTPESHLRAAYGLPMEDIDLEEG